MNAGETCRECGAVIPAGSPAGRCGKCLLALGLERTESIPDSAATSPTGATRVTPPLTEKPGDRIGRYKLLQKIGEGGCGIVYMAQQEEPVRRRVALKVIKLGMEGELTAAAEQRRTDPPRLIHLVRGDLDWIVMKCLEKDRTRRYETANGLAMDGNATSIVNLSSLGRRADCTNFTSWCGGTKSSLRR